MTSMAARPQSMEEAVQMRNEYLQISNQWTRSGVAMCDKEDSEADDNEVEIVALAELDLTVKRRLRKLLHD